MKRNEVKIIDISNKPLTFREAVVEARITLKPATIKLIKARRIPKGDVLTIAQCAGILAAKKVDELIPLCHTLAVEHVGIGFKLGKDSLIITARCMTQAKTGVEMEAMVAASIAALTVYDMCKFIEPGAVIEQIKLIEKRGGKSGHYKR